MVNRCYLKHELFGQNAHKHIIKPHQDQYTPPQKHQMNSGKVIDLFGEKCDYMM